MACDIYKERELQKQKYNLFTGLHTLPKNNTLESQNDHLTLD